MKFDSFTILTFGSVLLAVFFRPVAQTTAQVVDSKGAKGYIISTIVADGTLVMPTSVFAGPHGSFFVVDSGNFIIRRFDDKGQSSVIAGQEGSNQKFSGQSVSQQDQVAGTCYSKTGDHCLGTQAVLNSPRDVVLDSAENIFISDISAGKVRRVDAKSGIISTFAGGPVAGWSATQLHAPAGMAVDSKGNLFVADKVNNAVREIIPSTTPGGRATIKVIAGLGPDQPGCSSDGVKAIEAPLNRPQDVAIDAQGHVFIADTGCRKIREILDDGTMVTVAGTGADHTGTPPEVPFTKSSGPAGSINLATPLAITVDKKGNLLISDPGFNVVWLLRAADGTLTLLAGLAPGAAVCSAATNAQGDNCAPDAAFLNVPGKVAIDQAGAVYIPEQGGTRSPTHPYAVRLLSPIAAH